MALTINEFIELSETSPSIDLSQFLFRGNAILSFAVKEENDCCYIRTSEDCYRIDHYWEYCNEVIVPVRSAKIEQVPLPH